MNFLQLILFFGGFVGSIPFCVIVFGRAAPLFKDPVWWACAVVLSIGPLLLFEGLLNRRHRRKRLSIDQAQICFGGSCVQLADLQSISRGQFKVTMERYAPTLEKVTVIATHPISGASTLRGAAEARQKLRDHSLTLTLHSGKQVHWIGTLAYFEQTDLEAFFAALLERKPDLELKASATSE